MSNSNLIQAKMARNDEFYTQYADIEKEVNAYIEYDKDVFRDKTILCPCDNPEKSNFTKYFLDHFEELGLRKLISSCISPNMHLSSPLFNGNAHGLFLIKEQGKTPHMGTLRSNGDFRSIEVSRLRDESGIIVTNPPFSLFREFIAWIMKTQKKFLIIGNINAIPYKEVFLLVKGNKIWLGTQNGSKEYMTNTGEKKKFGNTCWFTNMMHGKRNKPLQLHTMEWNLKHSRHKEIMDVQEV